MITFTNQSKWTWLCPFSCPWSWQHRRGWVLQPFRWHALAEKSIHRCRNQQHTCTPQLFHSLQAAVFQDFMSSWCILQQATHQKQQLSLHFTVNIWARQFVNYTAAFSSLYEPYHRQLNSMQENIRYVILKDLIESVFERINKLKILFCFFF